VSPIIAYGFKSQGYQYRLNTDFEAIRGAAIATSFAFGRAGLLN